jgi:hypothetical protein
VIAPTVNWHGEVESKLVVRVGSHLEIQTVYQPRRDPSLLGAHGTLEGDPVVPGFRCPAAEIFAKV